MPKGSLPALTLLRELPFEEADGCRVLTSTRIAWRDGSKDRLFDIVGGASDLSSLSDELEQAATNWPERHHLAKSRANVLRPFALSRELTVLEVGASCGALTRYLGETCGTVDALEPVLERARVARARTRDLENVEVFVGEVEDLPADAAYDLVVVVGVLEYVGEGSADPEPYVHFLARLARVLRPGGHLICAIENRLGVKYLAGSPEDHTGRVFDGLEGYPKGGPARTLAREELAALFEHAGLQSTFFHSFPDYKLARAIFSDSLLDSPEERSLAWRLPHFPSADRAGPRPRLVDERSLWKSVVEDGRGGHFSNSFVIVASKGTTNDLWPTDLAAAFYNCERRALFATETRVRRIASGLRFERSGLTGQERRIECGSLVLELSDSDFAPGVDLVEVLAASDDETLREWLQRWRHLIGKSNSGGSPETVSIDLVPHNLILRDNGELAIIDQEWWHREYTERQVLERGIILLAGRIAHRCPPDRWGVGRVGELAKTLGVAVGLDPDGSWLASAIEREAALQAQVHDSPPDARQWAAAVESHRKSLHALLDQRLADTALGMREHELRANLEVETRAQVASLKADKDAALAEKVAALAEKVAALAEKDAALAEKDATLAQRQEALEQTTQELITIRQSLGYRILEGYRRRIRWLFPPNSHRGLPYRALRRLVRWLAKRR